MSKIHPKIAAILLNIDKMGTKSIFFNSITRIKKSIIETVEKEFKSAPLIDMFNLYISNPGTQIMFGRAVTRNSEEDIKKIVSKWPYKEQKFIEVGHILLREYNVVLRYPTKSISDINITITCILNLNNMKVEYELEIWVMFFSLDIKERFDESGLFPEFTFSNYSVTKNHKHYDTMYYKKEHISEFNEITELIKNTVAKLKIK